MPPLRAGQSCSATRFASRRLRLAGTSLRPSSQYQRDSSREVSRLSDSASTARLKRLRPLLSTSALQAEMNGASDEEAEAHEARALRVVGITFLVLAAYIVYEAGSTLWFREPPAVSQVGIVLAALSLIVMPFLAFAKLRAGQKLESRALIADSKETFVCSYLSLALLLGLGANALFGAWWADPVAALAMLPWVVKEGVEALTGDDDD